MVIIEYAVSSPHAMMSMAATTDLLPPRAPHYCCCTHWIMHAAAS